MFNEIIINSKNLINNINLIKQANPKSKICAMVKANAYGVGDKQVVKVLNNHVDYFGVACFFEAQKIKRYTNKKILIVGPLEYKKMYSRFSYTCSSVKDVIFCVKQNKRLNIHLKVNSGMNRYGFSSIKQFKLAIKLIKNSKLNLEGVFTHFATSDSYVKIQFKRFKQFVKIINALKIKTIIHADNSIVNTKFNHKLNMVRIGFNLYNKNSDGFLPVVNIKTTITQINIVNSGDLIGYDYRAVADRRINVAVVPIGYADGFDMKYIGLHLNIFGKQCKVLNICMDCFMLDVTNVNIKKGDKIYILNKSNPLSLYANYTKTSEYEVLTKFSHVRAKRKLSSISSN